MTGVGMGSQLSMSVRVLTAAGVSGTLLHMNCEGYTTRDRCAVCIFVFVAFFNHNTETSHLLRENSISLMKHTFT